MKWPLLLTLTSIAHADALQVYTYDSFTGPGSLGALMAEQSEAATGCATQYKVFPTAGEALAQVGLEGKNTHADIVVGVDQSLLSKANQSRPFEKLSALSTYGIPDELSLDPAGKWVPFEYGFLAPVYDDRRKNAPAPGSTLASFAENPLYKKKLVLE